MRVAIRFRAKTKLIIHTDYPKFIGMPAVWTDGGRSVYGHVITKFSGMGRLPAINIIGHLDIFCEFISVERTCK